MLTLGMFTDVPEGRTRVLSNTLGKSLDWAYDTLAVNGI